MILEVKATIISIYDKQTRGNNFEVTGVILKIADGNYYVEATGHLSSIPLSFQAGNPVKCKLQWYSNQDKRDSNKYWNNINILEMQPDMEKPVEVVQEKSFDDDLPF